MTFRRPQVDRKIFIKQAPVRFLSQENLNLT